MSKVESLYPEKGVEKQMGKQVGKVNPHSLDPVSLGEEGDKLAPYQTQEVGKFLQEELDPKR